MSSDYRQARYEEELLMEKAVEREVEENPLPENIARERAPKIPDLPKHQVVRYFNRLSHMNYGIDTGFYPLGSCTMKYNPKYTEKLASLSEATSPHPYQPEEFSQGTLEMMWELQELLAELGGMHSVSLQPAAGAQGEITGLMIAHQYHEYNDDDRNEVIMPDTAHGTNPASASMMGYNLVEIPSKDGCVDMEALEEAAGENTAAFMITNPNTLGLFETQACEMAEIIHDAGGLLYYDGANLNAIMGKTTPGAMDFDIMHFNLHKTFSTPHGGGGPGSGPVGVCEELSSYLPVPIVEREEDSYRLNYDLENSIGRVKGFYGNWLVLLRAYAYIVKEGKDGLKRATERAVLNSNYLRKRLEEHLDLPYKPLRKHEFVLSGKRLKDRDLKTKDLAKRLLDYGYHAPTIYFPQLVDEALMIEPTETESKATLDGFAEAVGEIMEEDEETIKEAPKNTSVGRVDETKAIRDTVLSYMMRE
ncbi:MAG: aminomethyl-transferring glycine dehydrogenase subunit GcvPB [Candidatus Natronoplasma sp.]